MWIDYVIPNNLFGEDLISFKINYNQKNKLCDNDIKSIINLNEEVIIELLSILNKKHTSIQKYKIIKETLFKIKEDLNIFSMVLLQIKKRQKTYKFDFE